MKALLYLLLLISVGFLLLDNHRKQRRIDDFIAAEEQARLARNSNSAKPPSNKPRPAPQRKTNAKNCAPCSTEQWPIETRHASVPPNSSRRLPALHIAPHAR